MAALDFLSGDRLWGRPRAMRRGPRPHLTYLALAAFDVVTVAGALILAHAMMTALDQSVKSEARWAELRVGLTEVRGLAGEVNAPGNDVFETGAADAEQYRYERHMAAFSLSLERLSLRLRANAEGDHIHRIEDHLAAIRGAADAMRAEALDVFVRVRAGDMRRASQHMAVMDRSFARLDKEIAALDRSIQDAQGEEFHRQIAVIERLRRFEMLAALAILVMVLAVAWHGVRLTREARRIERGREAHVAEMHRAREAAEAANRAKSDFLAVMSHEIRTPLNGVLGVAGLLSDTRLDADQHRLVGAIRRSGESLLALINDILDLSKLEAGKIELEIVDYDLPDLLDGVVELAASQAVAKGLVIGAAIDRHVPYRMTGDPGRIRQVLHNLVGNPVKFTERGGISLVIRAHTDPQPRLVFEVMDTGIGIPKDVQARLFEKFEQADASTSRQFGGTGLGLAICRRLATLMGGIIEVDSAEGRGSLFRLILPMSGVASGCRGCDLKGARVLVAEPSVILRDLLRRQISAWGASVVTVADATEALGSLAAAAPPDIVLMDADLPGMGARQLIRHAHLATHANRARFIVMSGVGGDARMAEREGIAQFLAKPISIGALLSVLATAKTAAPQSGLVARTTPPKDDASQAGPGLRVLLAEDNAVNQMVATAFLAKQNHRVDVAANGLEAVIAASQRDYDLILMDVRMPEMDGVAATAEIRRLPGARARVPIVALTANAMQGDRERYLAAGMDDYVAKPLDPHKLSEVIARLAYGRARGLGQAATEGFDETIVIELRDVIGAEAFAQLAREHAGDALSRLQRLEEALEAGVAAAVESEAHDLKSTSAAFGAMAVRDIALDVETCAREGRLAEAAMRFDALRAALTRALMRLDALTNTADRHVA